MGYIFEQEIEAIKNTVHAKTIGEEESIRLRHVLTASIHPSIKAYCKAEVEKLLAAERATEVRSNRLPYSLAEAMRLQKQIDVLLVHHYEFDKADFESLIDEAVHFQFNFLCRPQWTLLNFVFGNNRRVAVAEIEKKLRYCVDYSYFAEVLKRYFVDRGLAELEYEEFKSLIKKIDDEVVARHTSLELATMMRALFVFVNEGTYRNHAFDDQPKLPINAAIVFFEDKQLEQIQQRLEYDRDKRGIASLSVSALADVIEQVRTGKGREPETPQASPRSTFSPEIRIVKSESEEKELFVPTSVQPSAPSNAQEEASNDVLPSAMNDAPGSVSNNFSEHDRKVYVKSIFRKDEEAFQTALDHIDTLESWDDVSHFLDSLFVANSIDPFSVVAVTFTDRVFAKFSPSKKAL